MDSHMHQLQCTAGIFQTFRFDHINASMDRDPASLNYPPSIVPGSKRRRSKVQPKGFRGIVRSYDKTAEILDKVRGTIKREVELKHSDEEILQYLISLGYLNDKSTWVAGDIAAYRRKHSIGVRAKFSCKQRYYIRYHRANRIHRGKPPPRFRKKAKVGDIKPEPYSDEVIEGTLKWHKKEEKHDRKDFGLGSLTITSSDVGLSIVTTELASIAPTEVPPPPPVRVVQKRSFSTLSTILSHNETKQDLFNQWLNGIKTVPGNQQPSDVIRSCTATKNGPTYTSNTTQNAEVATGSTMQIEPGQPAAPDIAMDETSSSGFTRPFSLDLDSHGPPNYGNMTLREAIPKIMSQLDPVAAMVVADGNFDGLDIRRKHKLAGYASHGFFDPPKNNFQRACNILESVIDDHRNSKSISKIYCMNDWLSTLKKPLGCGELDYIGHQIDGQVIAELSYLLDFMHEQESMRGVSDVHNRKLVYEEAELSGPEAYMHWTEPSQPDMVVSRAEYNNVSDDDSENTNSFSLTLVQRGCDGIFWLDLIIGFHRKQYGQNSSGHGQAVEDRSTLDRQLAKLYNLHL